MRLRVLLVAAAMLATALPRAEAVGPLVLVSGRGNGGLMLVKVYGQRVVLEDMVAPPADGARLMPVQTRWRTVSYRSSGPCCRGPADVGLLDADTKTLSPVARDAAELLVSPDGRTRFLTTLRTLPGDDDHYRDAIVRTDAMGRGRTTLFSRAMEEAASMSSPALSPDGRTLYVGTSHYRRPRPEPSTPELWAVDTVSGDYFHIPLGTSSGSVRAVTASPDGRLLAVTLLDVLYTVLLVPLDFGPVRKVVSPGDMSYATAFTPDSRQVVLSSGESGLALADVVTGVAVPLKGTEKNGLHDAVPLTHREE